MTKLRVSMIILVLICLITSGCALFGGGQAERQRYIVAFSEDMDAMIQSLITENMEVLERFQIIDGILAMLTEDEVAWIEKNLPVKFIEKDIIHSIPRPVELDSIPNIQADTEIGWEMKMMNVGDAVWDRTQGQGVLVGIIDTGVDANHSDLVGAVVGGYNGITDSDAGWEDDNGHGTSVAGAVAGRRNGTGIVGVAPLASIYALKGLDQNGSGYSSHLLRCFQKALDLELDMVNCSWGSTMESRALSQAMENLAAWQGMGVICAAGNNARAPIIYPARNPVAVCVTAVDLRGDLASFSSFGEAVKLNGCAAPGEWVLAAKMGGGTRRVNGTSIAAPYVTGLLALTKAMGWPTRDWVFKGGDNYVNPDIYMGHGIIDVGKSIDELCNASN